MPRQYHKNPRQITTKQMTMLAHDLAELGDLSGIVHDLNSDEIIGGNQRSKIFDLAKLNIVLTEELPEPDEQGTVGLGYVLWQGKKYAYRAVRWDAKTAEKANIVANKAGGTWDFDILANEFEIDDLLEWGFEFFELGIEEEEPEPAEDPGAQIDRAEELREAWGVQPGQLWKLGAHRLICGDCTDAAVVERVMGGEKADMVFTDPPYNVASESRNFAADKSKAMKDLSESDWDKNFDIETVFPVLESVMATDCAVYVCTSHWLVQAIWEWMWKWSDFCFYCVWCKPNPMPSLSKRHWTWATELIPYAVRGKHVSNFPDGGHALNWWDLAKSKDTGHPTEKVLSVPVRAIEFSSNAGVIVFDCFLGSGTTLIACEQLGRRCRAVELSAAYVAVTIDRWATMTGQTPELITD